MSNSTVTRDLLILGLSHPHIMLNRVKGLFNMTLPTVDYAKYRTTMSSGPSLWFCLSCIPNFSQGAIEPEIATFAEGCFWGVEHIFLKHFPPSQNKGILKTSVGYTGGNPIVTYPTYRTVCSGATDHAEALRIEFDPGIVSYRELVGEYRTYCVLHVKLKLGRLFLRAFRILLSYT